MSILSREAVRARQRAAFAAPFMGDGTEVLNLIPWRRGGYEGAVALSFNR